MLQKKRDLGQFYLGIHNFNLEVSLNNWKTYKLKYIGHSAQLPTNQKLWVDEDSLYIIFRLFFFIVNFVFNLAFSYIFMELSSELMRTFELDSL